MNTNYKIEMLDSSHLEVPRGKYQGLFKPKHAKEIAEHFDENIANDPKVSCHDGIYRVVDGQHTIAARKIRNGGKDLLVRCKVFYDLTESEEARLFAAQNGISVKPTSGIRMRALLFAGDQNAILFQNATEKAGFRLLLMGARVDGSIACINAAYKCFQRVGATLYTEALKVTWDAWQGNKDSLKSEVLCAVIAFVETYHDMYHRDRLVRRLSECDPRDIYRKGKIDPELPKSKAYLNQIYLIYNGSIRVNALPKLF